MSGPLIFVVVGVTYLALAQFALWLDDPGHLGAGFWPGAGLTTAALLLLPTRRWGWVIAAVVAADLGGNLVLGYPLAVGLWWLAGNCAGPVAGATLMRRLFDEQGALVPVHNLIGFLLFGVVVGPLVGASLRSVGDVAVLGGPLWGVWPQHLIGDGLGVLVVAPALLTWRLGYPSRSRGETWLLVSTLALAPPLVFRNWGGTWDVALPHLVLPLLTWAALRFGVRGAALAVLWVTQIANWATASGYGPFAIAGASTGQAVTLLQLFLAVSSVSALILAALVADLSDRDQVQRVLRHQAEHDPLTGLPNRAFLTASIERVVHGSRRQDGDDVLLLCDLDDFKVVNDGLGHHVGDQVLTEVARRLQASVRPSDVVARLGGDEFVILAEGADDQAVGALTARLMTTVNEPVTLEDGQRVSVGMSVGIAVARPHHDAHELLRDADVALYRAKDLGRGRAAHFDDELRVQAVQRLALPRELRAGLSRKELFCLYQPEIRVTTGELFSFESLVRWQHPTRGLLEPDRFFPTAEKLAAGATLFDYVLGQTLAAQHRWAGKLGFHPAVSVNLSPRQLHDVTLPATVARTLERAGAPAGQLWLEVTESAMASDESLSTLAALHDLGVHLAIDDFGTGWSSMSRLSEFPWDLLKIDRGFIANLAGDEHAAHVVRAMIVMAHALGIETVAEGVETVEQLEILTALECDIVQGYLFDKPLDAGRAIDDLAPDGTWTGTHRLVLPIAAAGQALAANELS
jgi:diguanylate cyclase (GGDEF)-like protein